MQPKRRILGSTHNRVSPKRFRRRTQRQNKKRHIYNQKRKKQAVHFFLKYGFPNGKNAQTVQIPKSVLSATDPKIIKAFLRGLFSSDGCFSVRKKDNSPRVDLMVRSKMLRDQFVALISTIGFSFNTCDARRTKKGFTWKSTGWFRNANLCSQSEVIKWMKEVGSLCDTHTKKYAIWLRKIP